MNQEALNPNSFRLVDNFSVVRSIKDRDELTDKATPGDLVYVRSNLTIYYRYSGRWVKLTSTEDLVQMEYLNDLQDAQDPYDKDYIHDEQFFVARKIIKEFPDKTLFVCSDMGILYLYKEIQDYPSLTSHHTFNLTIHWDKDVTIYASLYYSNLRYMKYTEFKGKKVTAEQAIVLTKLFMAMKYQEMKDMVK